MRYKIKGEWHRINKIKNRQTLPARRKMKQIKLENLTREEYELGLEESLLNAKKILTDLCGAYNNYYLIDKERYSIEYFKKGQIYLYTKNPKRKIGFHVGE